MWADTTAVARVSKLQVYDQLCFGIYMVVQVGVWLRFSQVSGGVGKYCHMFVWNDSFKNVKLHAPSIIIIKLFHAMHYLFFNNYI